MTFKGLIRRSSRAWLPWPRQESLVASVPFDSLACPAKPAAKPQGLNAIIDALRIACIRNTELGTGGLDMPL